MIGAAQAEAYLHEHVPLTRQMQVRVAACDPEGVRIAAPLSPNINHVGTVFAGSASALAMLAGWTLIHARLAEWPFAATLVIRRGRIDYDRPIDGDFEAWCPAPAAGEWDRFGADLRAGRGRLELTVEVRREGRRMASFNGVYVALRNEAPSPTGPQKE